MIDLYIADKCVTEWGHFEIIERYHYDFDVEKIWLSIYPDSTKNFNLEGLTGKEAVEVLSHAIEILSLKTNNFTQSIHDDLERAFYTFVIFLNILLEASRRHPNGVWYNPISHY